MRAPSSDKLQDEIRSLLDRSRNLLDIAQRNIELRAELLAEAERLMRLADEQARAAAAKAAGNPAFRARVDRHLGRRDTRYSSGDPNADGQPQRALGRSRGPSS